MGFKHLCLILSASLLTLQVRAGFLCDYQSLSCDSQNNINATQKLAKAQCEIAMKASDCDGWFQKYPDAKAHARNCSILSTCSLPVKISEYGLTCLQGVGDSTIDFGKGVFNFLFGSSGLPPEIEEREKFFSECTTAKCKYDLLGPYANLFTKEEIEGYPNDKGLDPNNEVNKVYLNGFSAKTLYRKLLLKLKERAKNKGLSNTFIEPWSGQPSVLPQTMEELIQGALSKAGVYKTACYDPATLAQMRCYAFFSVVDPYLAVYSIKKIIQLAQVMEVPTVLLPKRKGLSELIAQRIEKLADDPNIRATNKKILKEFNESATQRAQEYANVNVKPLASDRDIPKKMRDTITRIKTNIQNTKYSSPEFKRRNNYTNAKPFIDKPVDFLPGDERMSRGLLNAFDDLHNKAKFADYVDDLVADITRKMLNSGDVALKSKARNGLIDQRALIEVLTERLKAKGVEPVLIPKGTGILTVKQFREFIKQGPVIDEALGPGHSLADYHGIYEKFENVVDLRSGSDGLLM